MSDRDAFVIQLEERITEMERQLVADRCRLLETQSIIDGLRREWRLRTLKNPVLEQEQMQP